MTQIDEFVVPRVSLSLGDGMGPSETNWDISFGGSLPSFARSVC